MRRIDSLESLIRQQIEKTQSTDLAQLAPPLSLSRPPGSIDDGSGLGFLSSLMTPPDIFSTLQAPTTLPDQPEDHSNATWDSREEPLTIPIGHLTPTGSLFSLEPIRRLIGEYPEDYFFQIESSRPFELDSPNGHLKQSCRLLNLDRPLADSLLAAFFSEIHPHFPILDPGPFTQFFYETIQDCTRETSVALCFVILALGKLASNRQARSPGDYTEEDGAEYFSLARNTLIMQWSTSFDPDFSLASGLVFSAIYLCYLERPLPAWKLVHMASTKIQIMVTQ